MSDKKIQPADPKATAPATEANVVEDKTADRKAAGVHYGGRKSGRKTNSVRPSLMSGS